MTLSVSGDLNTHPLISVDVGNSRIKFGLFDRRQCAGGFPECHHWLAVAAQQEIPWNDLRAWLPACQQPESLIAGTSPAGVQRVLSEWPENWNAPRQITNTDQFPLAIEVDEPRRVGVDRLLAALAAKHWRRDLAPVVTVDSGTATTVDVLTADGAFAGGAILAGFDLMARSLHQYTALLPYVAAEEFLHQTPQAPGKNTRAAISNGLFWGQIGAVKELVARTSLSCDHPPHVLLTGGGGELLVKHFPQAFHLPHLVLQGLVLAEQLLAQPE